MNCPADSGPKMRVFFLGLGIGLSEFRGTVLRGVWPGCHQLAFAHQGDDVLPARGEGVGPELDGAHFDVITESEPAQFRFRKNVASP